MQNVVRSILPSDMCVGCGVCVAICPDRNLHIIMNEDGEYNPSLGYPCKKECGLCHDVCPFGNDRLNEYVIGESLFGLVPGIQHDQIVGHYLSSFAGHVSSDARRVQSASGGITTWLLCDLLKRREIDAVICVSPTNGVDPLFQYIVARDVESIESSTGSVYYPVQLSDVLSYIRDTPGRYAITALPCFAKGIRLAQAKNKALRERIVYVIGLTCGQIKNKRYTDYLAALAGLEGNVSTAFFRGKEKNTPASNYTFLCSNERGKVRKLHWDEGVSEAWSDRLFTLNPCNYCDDIFAECADIVFMDAWLPEYIDDWRGTNIVIVRSRKLLGAIDDGVQRDEVGITPLSIDKVVQSQSGAIAFKRQLLRTRLWLAEREGQYFPPKRVVAKPDANPLHVIEAQLLKVIQDQSKKNYPDGKLQTEQNLVSFQRSMGAHQNKLRGIQRMIGLTRLPSAAIKRLRGANR